MAKVQNAKCKKYIYAKRRNTIKGQYLHEGVLKQCIKQFKQQKPVYQTAKLCLTCSVILSSYVVVVNMVTS